MFILRNAADCSNYIKLHLQLEGAHKKNVEEREKLLAELSK